MPETPQNSQLLTYARAALAVNNLRIKTYYLTFLTATTTILIAVLARALSAFPAPDKPEIQARNALRDRGVSDAEELLQHASPGRILAACRRWDAQRTSGRKLSPGWLATVVRNGGVDEREEDQEVIDTRLALHRRFEQLTRLFEPGTATESHMRLQARRWPDENPCPGQMIVTARDYPTLTVRCSECGCEGAYPLRGLAGLPKPSDPDRKPGLTIEGVGTPLLSAPLPRPGQPKPAALEFDFNESPFAKTSLTLEEAHRESMRFLVMFQLAADTDDEQEEIWAYGQMESAFLLLAGSPPAGTDAMWQAMRWAARIHHPPRPDLPATSEWLGMRRHPHIPGLPADPQFEEESLVSSNH